MLNFTKKKKNWNITNTCNRKFFIFNIYSWNLFNADWNNSVIFRKCFSELDECNVIFEVNWIGKGLFGSWKMKEIKVMENFVKIRFCSLTLVSFDVPSWKCSTNVIFLNFRIEIRNYLYKFALKMEFYLYHWCSKFK